MKKLWVLCTLLLALVIAACAPAAGRPAIPYAATQSEIIGEVAAFGPLIQPGGSYNYFNIEAIGGSYVTLVADQITGAQFLNALGGEAVNQPVRVIVTVVQNGGVARVAVAEQPRGDRIAKRAADTIVQNLDQRFRRAGG